jgi:hypothetical protein
VRLRSACLDFTTPCQKPGRDCASIISVFARPLSTAFHVPLSRSEEPALLEALWSVLSHPSTIDGRDGVGTLVLLAAIVALVTAGFMETVGRRVMTHSSISAILLGGAFLPGLATALAFLATRSNPEGTDGGGILIFAALVLSIGALPVTLATSVLYVVVREKSLRANGL